MSKQWWKGKQEAAAAQGGFPVAATSAAEPVAPPPASAPTVPATLSSHFEPTESSELHSSVPGATPSEYAATQMGSGMPPPMSSHVPLAAARAAQPVQAPGGELSFSTSKLFAIEVDDMATDPELEEAAIRFANGDDAGAEAGLLNALQSITATAESSASWAAALMDLYRATNNRARFDWAVVELAHVWGHAIPVWTSLADASSQGMETTAAAPFASSDVERRGMPAVADAIWRSPANLDEMAMEDLRTAMSTRPMPWVLDWSALSSIDAGAMPLVGGLFASLCDEAVSLQFGGADSLVLALRACTPSGDRAVDPDWWAVRLNALRSMQMLDEFELAALDYCVTYEVSPPAWEPARCLYEPAELASGTSQAGFGGESAATVPMGLMNSVSVPGPELRGDVLGDATQALAGLESTQDEGGRIVVSCRHLIRVDFSAAGSILNWVALRQAEGSLVQFHDVHRLVAAFFNVIGINEHARVIPRAM